MTPLTPWPTIQPHRLVWKERSYTDGVLVRLGWHVFYGAGYGPHHAKLEDAIADAERSIFASAYNQIIALGGWDTVAAVAAAAAAAAATRPSRPGS